MKNAAECADRLTALIAGLKGAPVHSSADPDDLVALMIESFMLWESQTKPANKAYRALCGAFVDFNEVRVALPHETAGVLGQRYPRAHERCERLRATLNGVFYRQQALSLERLREEGKRDIRRYIESLEGMVPFVSARVLLLAFETHAIPTDGQLRALLISEGAADPSASVEELASWLARHIKASDGLDTYSRFQQWVDSQPTPTGSRSRGRTAGRSSNPEKGSAAAADR